MKKKRFIFIKGKSSCLRTFLSDQSSFPYLEDRALTFICRKVCVCVCGDSDFLLWACLTELAFVRWIFIVMSMSDGSAPLEMNKVIQNWFLKRTKPKLTQTRCSLLPVAPLQCSPSSHLQRHISTCWTSDPAILQSYKTSTEWVLNRSQTIEPSEALPQKKKRTHCNKYFHVCVCVCVWNALFADCSKL